MRYESTKQPTAKAEATCSADPYTLTEPMQRRKIRLRDVYTTEDRHRQIAEAAYFRAQKRGFEPGHELEDWLAAEKEINDLCGLLEPHPNWDAPS